MPQNYQKNQELFLALRLDLNSSKVLSGFAVFNLEI